MRGPKEWSMIWPFAAKSCVNMPSLAYSKSVDSFCLQPMLHNLPQP